MESMPLSSISGIKGELPLHHWLFLGQGPFKRRAAATPSLCLIFFKIKEKKDWRGGPILLKKFYLFIYLLKKKDQVAAPIYLLRGASGACSTILFLFILFIYSYTFFSRGICEQSPDVVFASCFNTPCYYFVGSFHKPYSITTVMKLLLFRHLTTCDFYAYGLHPLCLMLHALSFYPMPIS